MFQTPPLPLLAQADRITPTVAPAEWRLNAPRYGGHSHALLLTEGKGTVQLSKGQLRAVAPCLAWMPPGAALTVVLDAGSAGFIVSCSENLVSMAISGGQPSTLRATADRLILGEIRPDDAGHAAMLAAAAETIHRELRAPRESGVELLSSCVTIMLVIAQRLSPQPALAQADGWPAPQLLQRFMQMVEVHFREQYTIRRYADELGVTERRLHDTVVKATGRGPLSLVHARLLEEARARLAESSLPVAQIAYGLGFRDPAHFTRFFGKAVGRSPRRYRADLRAARKDRETFAAWP